MELNQTLAALKENSLARTAVLLAIGTVALDKTKEKASELKDKAAKIKNQSRKRLK